MKIDHVALFTYDLEKMRQFYTYYFKGEENGMYHNPGTGLQTYFISFDDGARLEIMSRPGLAGSDNALRTGWAHLSFKLGSKEAVDAMTQKLREGGCTVESGPRTTGDGYYESCVLDPDGNRVELVA